MTRQSQKKRATNIKKTLSKATSRAIVSEPIVSEPIVNEPTIHQLLRSSKYNSNYFDIQYQKLNNASKKLESVKSKKRLGNNMMNEIKQAEMNYFQINDNIKGDRERRDGLKKYEDMISSSETDPDIKRQLIDIYNNVENDSLAIHNMDMVFDKIKNDQANLDILRQDPDFHNGGKSRKRKSTRKKNKKTRRR